MSDSPKKILRIDLDGLSEVKKRQLDRVRELMSVSETYGFGVEIDLCRSNDKALETVIVEEAGKMLETSQATNLSLPVDSRDASDYEKLVAVSELSEKHASLERKKDKRARERMAKVKAFCKKFSVDLVLELVKDTISKTGY